MAGERRSLGESVLVEYLRGRGVTENNLRRMIDDKIDEFVIPIMSDDELKCYIPQYGDRLAARYFISQRKVSKSDGGGVRSSVASGSSSTVLDRLRRKLNVDSMSSSSPSGVDSVRDKSLLGLTRVARCLDRNKTAGNEVMRAIEVGWLHTQTFDGKYRIVKAKDGGGIRKLCLPQQTVARSILLHAKNFFFPQGKSKFGLLEEFVCCLCNFNEQEMHEKEMSSTIAELYDLHKLSRLRFFIRTSPPCTLDWSSDDDFVSPKCRSSSVRMDTDVNSFMDSMDQDLFLPDLQTCESSPPSVISCSNTRSVAISDSLIISTVSHNVNGSSAALDSVTSSTYSCGTTHSWASSHSFGRSTASHSATRSLASSDSTTTSANSCSTSWLDDHTADSEDQSGFPNTRSVAISDSLIISTVSHNVNGSSAALDSVTSSTYSCSTTHSWASSHSFGRSTASHSATRSLASSDSTTTSANSCSTSWLDDHTADSEDKSGFPTDQVNLDSSQLEMQVTRCETVYDILLQLERKVDVRSPKTIVNIESRDQTHILEGAQRAFGRKTFDASRKLSVRFTGEDGADTGGLTRDFLRLAMLAIRDSSLFCGGDEKLIALDHKALNDGKYELAGRIIAYSIVHGGTTPTFMHPMMYTAISEGVECTRPRVSDLHDAALESALESKLQEILSSTSDDMYQETTSGIEDIIVMSGCISFCRSVVSKQDLVDAVCRHMLFDRVSVAINQFKKGLSMLGVMDAIEKKPDVMRELFVYSLRPLDATTFENLFSIQWSEPGSNRHQAEKRTFTHFRDLLQDLEGMDLLPCLLTFFTSMEQVPPLGFNPEPRLEFRDPVDIPVDDLTRNYPLANTCMNILTLPVLKTYDEFYTNVLAVIQTVTTFTKM